MKYWITILVSTDDVRPIYVGHSEAKANEVALINENVDCGYYCYVKCYEAK